MYERIKSYRNIWITGKGIQIHVDLPKIKPLPKKCFFIPADLKNNFVRCHAINSIVGDWPV